MPTVILVERDFMKVSMAGVISPRGIVRVPSTSKRARILGLAGGVIFVFLEAGSDMTLGMNVLAFDQ